MKQLLLLFSLTFQMKKSPVEFLKLFSKCWVVSNSKTSLNTNNYLENAAVNGDQKPLFLRAMAEWVEAWQTERIPNCEKVTLTAQTSWALVRTQNSSFIENLLGEGYDFVLISRLQSDPLQRRFGQYRQMSGGRFLVGLRDVTSSDRIIKIKSLLKEDLDIDNVKIDNTNDDETTSRLFSHTGIVSCSPEHLSLSDDRGK